MGVNSSMHCLKPEGFQPGKRKGERSNRRCTMPGKNTVKSKSKNNQNQKIKKTNISAPVPCIADTLTLKDCNYIDIKKELIHVTSNSRRNPSNFTRPTMDIFELCDIYLEDDYLQDYAIEESWFSSTSLSSEDSMDTSDYQSLFDPFYAILKEEESVHSHLDNILQKSFSDYDFSETESMHDSPENLSSSYKLEQFSTVIRSSRRKHVLDVPSHILTCCKETQTEECDLNYFQASNFDCQKCFNIAFDCSVESGIDVEEDNILFNSVDDSPEAETENIITKDEIACNPGTEELLSSYSEIEQIKCFSESLPDHTHKNEDPYPSVFKTCYQTKQEHLKAVLTFINNKKNDIETSGFSHIPCTDFSTDCKCVLAHKYFFDVYNCMPHHTQWSFQDYTLYPNNPFYESPFMEVPELSCNITCLDIDKNFWCDLDCAHIIPSVASNRHHDIVQTASNISSVDYHKYSSEIQKIVYHMLLVSMNIPVNCTQADTLLLYPFSVSP